MLSDSVVGSLCFNHSHRLHLVEHAMPEPVVAFRDVRRGWAMPLIGIATAASLFGACGDDGSTNAATPSTSAESPITTTPTAPSTTIPPCVLESFYPVVERIRAADPFLLSLGAYRLVNVGCSGEYALVGFIDDPNVQIQGVSFLLKYENGDWALLNPDYGSGLVAEDAARYEIPPDIWDAIGGKELVSATTDSPDVDPCSEDAIREALDAQAVGNQLPMRYEVADVRCHTQDGTTYAGARVRAEDEVTFQFAVFEAAGDGWKLLSITPDVLGSGLPRFLLSYLFPDDAGTGA
jgi:hypothetical protein